KAVNYAINREDMVEKLLAGVAPPMPTILTPRYPFANSLEGKGYPYDPAKSKELLSEAGWEDTDNDGIREKNGEDLILDYVVPKGEANANSIAVFVQSELEEVGIKVNVQIMERGAAGKAEDEGNFDLYLHHMYGIPGLPEGPLTGIYWSENPDPGDKWKYHSEELDSIIETALSSGKDEDYAKAYGLLQEEHACVPLYDIEKIVAHKKEVKGFEFSPSIYRANFGTVYLEK
ncbi:MAG: ABC transporter substrate-binding protein, partial [Archaeoglobaceae archaeon]